MLWRILWIIVWILIIVYVVKRAASLGRSQLGWGIFAAILPIIALIVILFMKPKA